MRHAVFLIAAMGFLMSSPAASQNPASGAAPAQAAVGACAVLTRDLVAPFTENQSILDLFPPEEETLGASGTACEYGAVRLQLYPGLGGTGSAPNGDFQPISDAGWNGFFRNNQDRYAELMVWTAEDYLTLQVSVPTGTAQAIKPDVVGLANAILAKLPGAVG